MGVCSGRLVRLSSKVFAIVYLNQSDEREWWTNGR